MIFPLLSQSILEDVDVVCCDGILSQVVPVSCHSVDEEVISVSEFVLHLEFEAMSPVCCV